MERKPFRMSHLSMESMLQTLNKILMPAHPEKVRKAHEEFLGDVAEEAKTGKVFSRLHKDAVMRTDREAILRILAEAAPSEP